MTATGRALAGAKAVAEWVRDEGARLLRSVRAWDRYLRMRIAVLSVWGLLALAAIGIARTGAGAEADNPLQAYVSVRRSAMGWALLVHNQSERPWRDVAIELDGGRTYRREVVEPDEKLVLSPWEFAADGGEVSREPPRAVSLRVGRKVVRPPLSEEPDEG